MSCQRRCDFWLATDGKWYVELGNREYAEESHDCTRYGPFDTEDQAKAFVFKNHSNPGGSCTDHSGQDKPPTDAVRPYDRRRW